MIKFLIVIAVLSSLGCASQSRKRLDVDGEILSLEVDRDMSSPYDAAPGDTFIAHVGGHTVIVTPEHQYR